MAEVERIADNARSRRIPEELLQNALRYVDLHKRPLREVGREPVSVAVRGEEPVLSLENDDRRIGGLHVNALRQSVRTDLPVAVVDHVLYVNGVARRERLWILHRLGETREIVRRTGLELDARVADLVVDPRLFRFVRYVVVVEQLGDLKPTAVRGEAVERTPRRHPHARGAIHRRHLLLEGGIGLEHLLARRVKQLYSSVAHKVERMSARLAVVARDAQLERKDEVFALAPSEIHDSHGVQVESRGAGQSDDRARHFVLRLEPAEDGFRLRRQRGGADEKRDQQ